MQTQQNKKKYLEELHELFPTHSKMSLESGMRRVADYIGNSWQVQIPLITLYTLHKYDPNDAKRTEHIQGKT